MDGRMGTETKLALSLSLSLSFSLSLSLSLSLSGSRRKFHSLNSLTTEKTLRTYLKDYNMWK